MDSQRTGSEPRPLDRRSALRAAGAGALALAATGLALGSAAAQPSEEEAAAIAVIEELIARFNAGDIAGIRALVTDDIETVWPWPTPPGEGAAYVERAATRLKEAFPDGVVTIDETIADGNRVAVRLTSRGTQSGALFTLEPTGQVIELLAMFFLRVTEGKITSCVALIDTFALVQQLGLLEGIALPVGSPVATPAAAGA